MSLSLAALERALREERALLALSEIYVHRARREDSLGFLIGRDAILADWVHQEPGKVNVSNDLGLLICIQTSCQNKTWATHRWVKVEADRVVGEIVVEYRGIKKEAADCHAPLGELRAGRGQFDAGLEPPLPPDWPPEAKSLADKLHRAWNGRAFNLYTAPWLTRLVRTLPDATFYFERAIVKESHIAILWRVHGHHSNGQRVRLIGSSVFDMNGDAIVNDETIVDFDAMDAQLQRKLISYD
jgi:predicted ester cyclase